ncbi:hypothetical protein STEG23_010593, partial [Scotinomys teguina]
MLVIPVLGRLRVNCCDPEGYTVSLRPARTTHRFSQNVLSRRKESRDPEAAMMGHWLGIIKAYSTMETKFEEENASPEFSGCWERGSAVSHRNDLAVVGPMAHSSFNDEDQFLYLTEASQSHEAPFVVNLGACAISVK